MAQAPALSSSAAAPRAMTGATLGITAVALALGTFMQVLDSTIANVSVPTIIGDLGGSSSQGTWVITAFAIANGISLPLTAWLMQRFGIVRTFVSSVLLFTAASFLCGVAWSLPSLIFFRVLQGLVSGPMMPGSQALLITIFPPKQRSTALAIWSMTTLVAPVCGPIFGGYISDNIHWSWIFLVNVPIGLACAFVCIVNLKSYETPTRKLPVDVMGFSLLVLWVSSLQIMLDTGKDADWFSSPLIVIEAILAVVGFIVWVIWETSAEHPIVDLSLFRKKNFALGTIVFAVGYATFFGGAVLMPIWLQTQMGYTATWAGLVAAPAGAVGVMIAPVLARFTSKIDARLIASVSIIAFALSLWMRSLFGPDADFMELMLPSIALGVGLGTFFVSMVTICLNGVPPQQVAQATGLTTFVRTTSAAFATSLTTTIWERQEHLHQTRLAEVAGHRGDPQWMAALDALQERGASLAQATAALTQQIVHQAFYLAVLDVFRMCAWVTIALLPLIWLTKKALAGHGAPAGGD